MNTKSLRAYELLTTGFTLQQSKAEQEKFQLQFQSNPKRVAMNGEITRGPGARAMKTSPLCIQEV